jgi:hypothetical protein
VLEWCHEIIDDQNMVQCINDYYDDATGQAAFDVFYYCQQYFCTNDQTACAKLKQLKEAGGCKPSLYRGFPYDPVC